MSERVYMFLQPNIRAVDEDIQRYTSFLTKLEAKPKSEGRERLLKSVKESIEDLTEKKAARDISRYWSASQQNKA